MNKIAENYRRFKAWRLGWTDGASMRPKKDAQNPDYVEGYREGIQAREAMSEQAMQKYRVTPEQLEAAVLREASEPAHKRFVPDCSYCGYPVNSTLCQGSHP